MTEYQGYEYKCDKCESVNVKTDFWEDEYAKSYRWCYVEV